MSRFADVILPLPLDGLFTYSIPDEMSGQIVPGVRVRVPFGHSRTYTALVVRVHNLEPADYAVKPVLAVLDSVPIVTEHQLRMIDWMSDYYLCSKGDVLKAMLPGIFRPSGNDKAREYRPRTEICVRIAEKYRGKDIAGILDSLSSAPKQAELFTAYLDLSGLSDSSVVEPGIVSRRALLNKCASASALEGLVSKGIFENWKHEIGALPLFDGNLYPPNELNCHQKSALDRIRESFLSKNICLLHGVTSSGKTEVYIHLMLDCVRSGGQVLFLLPEIALTLHIMRRLQRVFGDDMCVYHSRCTDSERAEIWLRQLGPNPFKIIVGARSAIFLPFRNLKLVVVDEEHDQSYRQEEPAPRYNARNTALVLASYFDAKVLLGSATPSMETYYNARSGKYGLALLEHRYLDLPMPRIDVVDVNELRRKRQMHGILSPLLERYIRNALDCGNQVILLRNRRGYSPAVHCRDCGWIPVCDSCDVSLTWHRSMRHLSCHYCGKTYQLPAVCPKCGSTCFDTSGYGTEKVEEEIHTLFPKAVTGRLDLDTVTSSTAYTQILQDFQDGVTNILIGTQMVAKGLDFERVSVVGILDADSIMGAPDFRSAERMFQMLQQVSGRAGRRNLDANVVIQTQQPDNPIYPVIVSCDWNKFFSGELDERRVFNYPPFSRIIYVCLKSSDAVLLEPASEWLGSQMRFVFGDRVLGPDVPPVSRVRKQFIRKLMLKVESGISMAPVRKSLLALRQQFMKHYPQITAFFDVDPM